MNERPAVQQHLDFLTGVPTFIHGDVISAGDKLSCGQLNRRRSDSIKEAHRQDASWKSVSADVWATFVAGRARELELPLVALEGLGFLADDPEYLSSKLLTYMANGREATAWLHRERSCVYKLFDLRQGKDGRGFLGSTLYFEPENDHDCRIPMCDATLIDTLDKLCVLHDIGACPTEIIGLSDNGKYLIVKQPRCWGYDDLHADRQIALDTIKAHPPDGSYDREVWVFWADDKAWCISDLHQGNIRRTAEKQPTIIDALVTPIPKLILSNYPRISRAAAIARSWRETGVKMATDLFKDICDDEL